MAFPGPSYGLRLSVSVVAAVAVGVVAWVLRQNDPAATGLFPPCVVHVATGLHCPGCGSTRAAHALLNGDVGGAVKWNLAFVLAVVPVLFGVTLLWLRWLKPHRNWLQLNFPRVLPWCVLAALLVFGVLRNLFPNSFLAPQ